MNLARDKAELRQLVGREVAAISSDQRMIQSGQLRDRLKGLKVWREARTVFAYAALADEPVLDELLAEAIVSGRRVALPRFDQATSSYQAVAVQDWSRDLVAAKFGVREPKPGGLVVPWKQLDLVLVPGVAFDRRGARLGRGRGFYDRLLVDCAGHRCGVAFDVQIAGAVPEEAHDRRMNSILTPTRWFETGVGGDD